MAIIRIIASINTNMFTSVPDEQTAVLLSDAEARKKIILNTESDWTLGEGGTVYYVSPNGDDANDGLTPETAWRSLDKINSATIRDHSYLGSDQDIVEQLNTEEFPAYAWAVENPDNWAELNPGDVVLFERGGIWRGQFIDAKGVTYSAYGEGAKPEIWGSPENGSSAGFLLHLQPIAVKAMLIALHFLTKDITFDDLSEGVYALRTIMQEVNRRRSSADVN